MAAGAATSGPAAAHVHAWRGMEFTFEAGHPFVRQQCDCGAERSFRAWERYWEPAASSEAEGRPMPGGSGAATLE